MQNNLKQIKTSIHTSKLVFYNNFAVNASDKLYYSELCDKFCAALK